MADAEDLCYTPATELARRIARRRVSPVEVVQAVLDRLESVNRRLNAFVTVAPEQALAAARAAEERLLRGDSAGPLLGIPVSIKDITPTAGIRTTFGSRIFADHVPQEDAAVVQRLKSAGAVVLGKTNTPEFAMKGATDNPLFGPTRNPWEPRLSAGGSSGGAAAAVAAGLGPLAEGTDIAGSIRIPAALCGVVGLKPSAGRIPRYPAVDAWESLNVHGPLARTVRDAALFLDATAGRDERDPLSLPDAAESYLAACDAPLPALRVAWTPDLGYAAVDPRVERLAAAAARTFEPLGCAVVEDQPGFPDPADLFFGLTAPGFAPPRAAYLDQWADRMDPFVVRVLRRDPPASMLDYERLRERRTQLWHTLRHFFSAYDLLLTPTTALPAFPVDDPYPPATVGDRAVVHQLNWFPCTYPFNLTGHPAISLPAGWTDDGLPVGLQLVGRPRGEALLLCAAAAYEQARPWAESRPPLSGARDQLTREHRGTGPAADGRGTPSGDV